MRRGMPSRPLRRIGGMGMSVLLLLVQVLVVSCGTGDFPAIPTAVPTPPVARQLSGTEPDIATRLPAVPTSAPASPEPSPLVAVATPLPPPSETASPRPSSTATASPTVQPTATAAAQPTVPAPTEPAQTGDAFYAVGAPILTDLYISPNGDDGNGGTSRSEPLQTIGAAWRRIPEGTLSGTGYRLNLLPGTYPCEGDCVNWFSDRSGTYVFPVVLQAADGPGTVTLKGGLNLYNVRYLYLLDLTLRAGQEAGAAFGNNVLHLEYGDHILLRGLTVKGPLKCITDACNDMQEVVKVNQSQFVFVEQCDIGGTFQTALDFFSVQNGHLLANHIHRSGGRCAYLKGGSAYFRVAGNEFDDCREAGFQAGEGSNLAFMRSPWLHYEAYDIKVYNNVFHDIYGAGLSVNGGYNILLAYNTLYRIGLDDEGGRTWPLVQLIHGWRGCVAAEEYNGAAGTRARCQEQLTAGGWGTATLGWDSGGDWIPNRNVLVLNNVFYNPNGTGTHYVQFVVNGPINPPAHAQNLSKPSSTDTGLVIRGNIIWNAPLENAGLVGDNNGSGNIGCLAQNPTCNLTQLQAENQFNAVEPQLRDPTQGDFRLQARSPACAVKAVAVPNFAWGDAPAKPAVPAGDLDSSVLRDRAGKVREAAGPPGAYACGE